MVYQEISYVLSKIIFSTGSNVSPSTALRLLGRPTEVSQPGELAARARAREARAPQPTRYETSKSYPTVHHLSSARWSSLGRLPVCMSTACARACMYKHASVCCVSVRVCVPVCVCMYMSGDVSIIARASMSPSLYMSVVP